MALQLAMSVGVYIAWPQQTRIGFFRCRSVLCAKSYNIKKNRPTTRPWSSSSSISGCSGCVVGSNVWPAAPAVDGRACRRGPHGVGIAATTAAVCGTTRHESAGCGMRVL